MYRKWNVITGRRSRQISLPSILLLLTMSILVIGGPATDLGDSPCQAVINQALQTMQDKCSDVARNSACYGNDRISTQFVDNLVPPKFNVLGDVVSIKEVKSLLTSPLNMQDNTWGLALLKLQANLPDTLPGQNVIFLVYGNTAINNTSGDMRVFYFSSGLGAPTCTEMPEEGIVVQSPNHIQVSFTANGVEIQIASTILLHAETNKTLDVTLLEGHATVSTSSGAQSLQPSQMVSVPMGGTTGLDPSGPPSSPVNLDSKQVAKLHGIVKATQIAITPSISVPIVLPIGTPPIKVTLLGIPKGGGDDQTPGKDKDKGNDTIPIVKVTEDNGKGGSSGK